MPASYVHQCVARKALKGMFGAEEALMSAALAGAEGPDPFFFSVAPNPGGPYPPQVGTLLHTKRTDDFLLAMLDACAGAELSRAYALGFFTHYAADTTCHPFVYAHALTAQGGYSSTAHCLLEHRLETLHYRRTGHPSGLPVQFAGYAALSRAQKDALAAPLADAIAAVFPEQALTKRRVAASFEDGVRLCRLFRSEGGTKFRAMGALPFGLADLAHSHMMPLEPPEEDIANDARAPWASIWQPDLIRNESFDDLFEAAVSRAAELTACAAGRMSGRVSEASLRALTGALSYDSGLPWRDTRPAPEALEAARAKGEAQSNS